MSAILIYIAKSTLYLTLLYAFYLGVMRNASCFRLNRWMLLAGTMVCMLLPFYTVSIETSDAMQMPMQPLSYLWTEEVLPEETIELQSTSDSISFIPILFIVYLVGMLVCMAFFHRSMKRIEQLIDAFPVMWKEGSWLVVVPDRMSSFSWNNHIVINEEDFHQHPAVMAHEQAHLSKHHSWDMMFFSVVNVLHWFNPLVWRMKKELQLIHEFEADKEVINQGFNATEYQLLLVKKAVGPKLYSMANGFHHHKLKKRITMMHQEKTNKWGRLKWLMVVPVVAGAMFLFARPEVKQVNNLASYKAYFQEAIRKQDLSKVKTGNVYSFNVSYDNRISINGKEIASPKDIKQALAPIMELASRSSDEEIHCLGVAYESATNESHLCSYLQEIKEAYEEENLIPLVFINEPVYADAEGVKRYYGIEISFPGKHAHTLRNFTAQELKDAVKQVSIASNNDDYVKVNFRATESQKMENVNEVRQMLKQLYHPQNVIFRQTVWKEYANSTFLPVFINRTILGKSMMPMETQTASSGNTFLKERNSVE